MSDATARLSHAAVNLLLTIIETPSMVISGAALDGYHARAGAELVAAGALDADGFEPVAVSQADHDDGVVSLAWDGDARRHAYFSPAAGMVAVEDHALRRLRVRSSWLLDWLARELGIAGAVRPVELVPNHVWDLGDLWLGERKSEQRRTAIYVARRLGEPGAMLRTRTALQSRAGRPPGDHTDIIAGEGCGGLRRSRHAARTTDHPVREGGRPAVPLGRLDHLHRCTWPAIDATSISGSGGRRISGGARR